MSESMTGREAIVFASRTFNKKSLYSLAASLCDEHVRVQPTQISNYLTGTRMSPAVAKRFLEVYGIEISDVYRPGALDK